MPWKISKFSKASKKSCKLISPEILHAKTNLQTAVTSESTSNEIQSIWQSSTDFQKTACNLPGGMIYTYIV